MNIKHVLKVYSGLRQLSDDESALLETLRTMNDSERELLVETLSPQKSPSKKSSSKSAGKGAKSKRASSLQGQIQGVASRTVTGLACATCGNVEDHPDHDIGHYLSAHEFDGGKSSASTAERASSANGAGVSSTVNSETQPEDVSNVHHVASGGD